MKISWIVLAASAATLTCASAAADAAGIDLPARKPGQWEIKMTPKTAGAAPTMITQLCLDAASDQALMQQGLAMSPGCATQQSRDANGNLVFDAACDSNGRKTQAHSVISGDFQSHYVIDIVADTEGGGPGQPKHTEVRQEASWKGACQAGMKPGDMLLPGGRKVNILSVLKSRG